MVGQLMKVRLRQRRAGPDGCDPPGAVVEVSAAIAKQLIATNQADPVEAPLEVATMPPAAETAAKTGRPEKKAVQPKDAASGDKE